MPNQPDINKTQVSMQVSVEDDQRLKRLSRKCGKSKACIAASILHEGLKDVPLEASDYEEIASIMKARQEQRRKL